MRPLPNYLGLLLPSCVGILIGLMVGSTDTKHYLLLSPNVYRFSPTLMYRQDIPHFHGDNERISVENYGQVINYYSHLMTNVDLEFLPTVGHEIHSADLCRPVVILTRFGLIIFYCSQSVLKWVCSIVFKNGYFVDL